MPNEIQVYILPPEEKLILPENLQFSAGFPVLDSWMMTMSRIYNYSLYRIVAILNKDIVGVMSLIHIKHKIFGDYLTTAPYASYGGFTFLSPQIRDSLLEQVRILGDDLGVEYVNIRFESIDAEPPSGWIQHPVYATYRANLLFDIDKLLASYDANHRNHIRKSLKKGFIVRFGGLEILDDVYEGLSKSMHELGSPYHSKEYLRSIASSLGDGLEFVVLKNGSGDLVGAGVFIISGGMVTNLHANILRKARPDYGGEFLYWSVITHYLEKGIDIFDFGRSLIGSGNENFKMKWNPDKKNLAYWYYLYNGHGLPSLNQKNPKFRFAIWVWQRLPVFLVRLIGPSLIRGLA